MTGFLSSLWKQLPSSLKPNDHLITRNDASCLCNDDSKRYRLINIPEALQLLDVGGEPLVREVLLLHEVELRGGGDWG